MDPEDVLSSSKLAESRTLEKSEESKSKPKSEPVDRRVRELNKRLKTIAEDEGVDYGPDASVETIVDRFKVATRLRKTRIEDVFRLIYRARIVQLCFLVDATGSMDDHINGVKRSIDEIVRKLTDAGPGKGQKPVAQSMTLAFVAYRDFGDAKQFEVLQFTDNTERFKAFTTQLDATGGDDGPEDVFGGIEEALKLAWSEQCGTKVIFHICDAPCHGNDFHRGIRDNYPSGDPKGRTCERLFSRIREKGIQYYFGKIDSLTDIMIEKFSRAYGEPITDFDVKNVDKIRDSVITSVTAAVSASVSGSVGASHRPEGRVLRPHTIDASEPDWASLDEKKGFYYTYEFPKSIEDIVDDIALVEIKNKHAIIKIAKNPFGKGAERLAYFGKNLSEFIDKKAAKSSSKEKLDVKRKDEDIVLKESLYTGKGMNAARRYESSNQMQTIAAFLAQKFTKEVKDKLGVDQAIKFLKIKTLCIEEGLHMRFMSLEKRLTAGVKFVRFTNNADYHIMEESAAAKGVPMQYVRLVTAFSHWTYKATNRYLMVVDLEGIIDRIGDTGTTGVLLTDPAIHCTDATRFGSMNLGPNGMKTFFERHECNEYCRKLGLNTFVC